MTLSSLTFDLKGNVYEAGELLGKISGNHRNRVVSKARKLSGSEMTLIYDAFRQYVDSLCDDAASRGCDITNDVNNLIFLADPFGD